MEESYETDAVPSIVKTAIAFAFDAKKKKTIEYPFACSRIDALTEVQVSRLNAGWDNLSL